MASDTLVPIVPKIQGEIIAHSVVTLIVLVVVGIRLLGRVRGIGLGWDDGLVVIATVCIYPNPYFSEFKLLTLIAACGRYPVGHGRRL